MDQVLNDVRILKLAELYERRFESFVAELTRAYVCDEELRAMLLLAGNTCAVHGDRITGELDRLNRALGDVDARRVERAAIQDILEVERAAHAFYLKYIEEVHDPHIMELFRDLAKEKRSRVRLAEDALACHDRRSGHLQPDPRPDPSPAWPDLFARPRSLERGAGRLSRP